MIPSNCIVSIRAYKTGNKCKEGLYNLPYMFINENYPPSTAMNKEFLTQTVRGNTNIIDRDDNWNLLLYKEAYHIKCSAPSLSTGLKASRELWLLSWQFLFFFCIFTCLCWCTIPQYLNLCYLYFTSVWRWYSLRILHQHNAIYSVSPLFYTYWNYQQVIDFSMN